MVIWKHSLNFVDEQTLPIPATAKILSVQMQGENICVWAMLDPTHAVDRGRTFAIIGTRDPIEFDGKAAAFIGTVQARGGQLVLHVFEVDPPQAFVDCLT